MEMRQLLQVMEVYKAHSIGKAAENLFVSQPTLTVSIRRLEDELGEPLFVRSRSGTEATEFGRRFVQYIAPLCEQFHMLDTVVNDIKRRSNKELTLSVPPSKVFCKIYGALLKKHRGSAVNSRLKECFTHAALEDIENGRSEIAVVSVTSGEKPLFSHILKVKGIEYTELFCASPVVGVRRGHPLSGRDSLTLDDLRSYPRLIYSEGTDSAMFEDALDMSGSMDRLYVNSRAALEELVLETDAFTVTPLPLEAHVERGENTVRLIPLDGTDVQVHVGWIRRAGAMLGQLAEEYVKTLEEMLIK